MHEMGIVAEVLSAAETAAREAGAARVTRVVLTVGELTAVVPEALEFAWEALTPGTIVEGAVLEVTAVPARSKCLECGVEFSHDRVDRRCTGCGGYFCEVLSGDELRIDIVDVDLPGETSDREPAQGGA